MAATYRADYFGGKHRHPRSRLARGGALGGGDADDYSVFTGDESLKFSCEVH